MAEKQKKKLRRSVSPLVGDAPPRGEGPRVGGQMDRVVGPTSDVRFGRKGGGATTKHKSKKGR